jgi:hypothetical protein
MIGNKYQYGLIDLSYLLMRNVFAVSRGKKKGEFTAGDVIKMTIQTLNKIPRDFNISVDKYILVRDTWSKDYAGYYRTYLLNGLYKTTREYITEEKVEEMKKDPTKTPEEIEEKTDAKWGLIKGMKDFGVPCISVEGWEFDDLAYLASQMLYSMSEKPSVIITKDSDLKYSLTPKMDYFRIPTGGSAPQVITYNEVYQEIPEPLRDKVSLYQYKALLDSIGEGHNDMTKTRLDKVDPIETISKILREDYSNLADYDTFVRQYNSFDISKFPRLQEAQQIIANDLGKLGRLGGTQEFNQFCSTYGISGISDRYFTEFIHRFDPKLFSDGK